MDGYRSAGDAGVVAAARLGAATVSISWSEYLNKFLEVFGTHVPFEWSHSPFEKVLDASGVMHHGIINIPAMVIDNSVRLEQPNGHQWIPKLVEAFPNRTESITLGKPTLEDVFIHFTGHRFWNETPSDDANGSGRKKRRRGSH